MNGTEFTSNQPADSGSQDLRFEVESLRGMFAFMMLLMIVFTACVNLFLFHQVNTLVGEANEAQRRVAIFQTVGSAQAVDFWNKLNDYGSRHADFAPVLTKYNKFINVRTNGPVVPKK
jgi:hypothetical protein